MRGGRTDDTLAPDLGISGRRRNLNIELTERDWFVNKTRTLYERKLGRELKDEDLIRVSRPTKRAPGSRRSTATAVAWTSWLILKEQLLSGQVCYWNQVYLGSSGGVDQGWYSGRPDATMHQADSFCDFQTVHREVCMCPDAQISDANA
jgi:hypothetical protein